MKDILPQEGNSWHQKEFHATRRKFLFKVRHSCDRKEIPVTGRKFLLQEGNSCHRKEINVKGGGNSDTESTIPLKEGDSCYRGEIMFHKRNSWYWKEIP